MAGYWSYIGTWMHGVDDESSLSAAKLINQPRFDGRLKSLFPTRLC